VVSYAVFGTEITEYIPWPAAVCSPVPDKGEQPVESLQVERMVRYYGFYSNVSLGRRKKQDQDGLIPAIASLRRAGSTIIFMWMSTIQKSPVANLLKRKLALLNDL
jgi:hypothetical protein